MKALVTGGGGFLGGAISRMLLARGDKVTILGRRDYPEWAKLGARCTRTDVRDAAAVAAACVGMDVVFHVAALAGIWGRRDDYFQTNVLGTRHVIAGCRAAGVGRLVFTSSPSVVMTDGRVERGDESLPYPSRFLTHYSETKAIAEREVLAANGTPLPSSQRYTGEPRASVRADAAAPHSPEIADAPASAPSGRLEPTGALLTVALRPHLIWGPGDPHLMPRVVDRARRGRLIRVGDGRNLVDITYVDNAAAAHVDACDALRPSAACAGRAYFITNDEPLELWRWFADVLRAIDAPPVGRSMSYRTAYAIGAALEIVYRALAVQREPVMTRFLAGQLALPHHFDITAAKRDLGYKVRVTVTEGTPRLIEWLRRRRPG